MIITASRKPSQKTRSFVNDLARVLGLSVFNRGKTPINEISEKYPKYILVGEYTGNPGRVELHDTNNNLIISMLISAKLQREVCNKEIANPTGLLDISFDRIYNEECGEYKYKELFLEFFDELNGDSDFKMSFEGSDGRNLFYIQFYNKNEKIGPLIIVKSIKIMDKE